MIPSCMGNDGRLRIHTGVPDNTIFLQGIRCDSILQAMDVDQVAVGAYGIGGVPVDRVGRVCIEEADPVRFISSGLGITASGKLSVDLLFPPVEFQNGMGFTRAGRLCCFDLAPGLQKFLLFNGDPLDMVATPAAHIITDDFSVIFGGSWNGTASGRAIMLNVGPNPHDLGDTYAFFDVGNRQVQLSFSVATVRVYPTWTIGAGVEWIKITRVGANCNLFTSSDGGSTWIDQNQPQVVGLGAVTQNSPFNIGPEVPGYSMGSWNGLIYRVQVLNNLGIAVYDCNPNLYVSGSTFTSPAAGDLWTISGTVTVLQ